MSVRVRWYNVHEERVIGMTPVTMPCVAELGSHGERRQRTSSSVKNYGDGEELTMVVVAESFEVDSDRRW